MNTNDKTHQMALMGKAHVRFLERIGQYNGNIGWVVTHDVYLSKTRAGLAETRRIGPRKYKHTIKAWSEVEA